MTYTLAEIKKMLEGITSWPWSHCGSLPADGTSHVCSESDTVFHNPFLLQIKKYEDVEFIASAPQIISELVGKLEECQHKLNWALRELERAQLIY